MGIVSPPKDSVPQAALTRCLRELPNCVVLRNEEDLFGNLQRGGDVDLLVADLELAERTLIRHLGVPVRIIRSSYVSGYSYEWGHVDLVPTIEWRGACYLRTEAVLESRRLSASGRPVPRIAHEALVAWLTNILCGGFFKERYAAEIRKAVETDGPAFRQALIEVAGNRLGGRLWQAAAAGHPEISAEWTRVSAAGRLVASLLQVTGAHDPTLLRVRDRGTQTSIRAAGAVDCDSRLGRQWEILPRRTRSFIVLPRVRTRRSKRSIGVHA